MITVYEVVNEAGFVRKVFRQKARANKYAHDLNQWLGSELVWFVRAVPNTIYNPANPDPRAESDFHTPPLVAESRKALADELRAIKLRAHGYNHEIPRLCADGTLTTE